MGAEDKNDRMLILMTVGFGAVGAFYGVETSSSPLGALALGLWYGFVGVTIGAPLAFAINISAIGVSGAAAASPIGLNHM